MSLPETILAPLARALANKGYETLTPVQAAIIEDETAGRDLLVSAQTGSGKTVAFGMAIAPTLLGDAERFTSVGAPLALLIAPTRELALQVQRELEWLYAETGAKTASCVGGMDARAERRALDQGAHIVVGTPGRLRDHITRGALDMSALRAVVLDEADEMLDLGFREDLEFILDAAPEDRRTLLFSATVPKPIAQLAKIFQRNALRVAATSATEQHADIDYKLMLVPAAERENAIINTLLYFEAVNTIVFASTREGVKHLSARLHNRGFAVVTLSGELSQAERTNALQSMRDGRAHICVATDVAARGIDLPNLDLVIHADLPNNPDTLLHRSGRTGRAGRKGTCVIISPMHRRNVAQRILKTAKLDVTMMAPPTAAEIDARFREGILSAAILTTPATEDEAAMVTELLARHSVEAIAGAYLRQQLAARPAPEDISDNPVPSKPGDSDPRVREKFEGGTWFKVSVGRKQKAEPRWLLPMLCKAGNVTKTAIGSIRIFDTESIFEVAAPKADAFARSVEKNGSGERGVTISAVDGPGERRAGPPPSQRRPPGPVERFDPNAPRPERADRQARYGSAGLRPDDFAEPATGSWNPAAEAETPRQPKPDFDKPRPPKVAKAPPAKDKGKPKWAGKPADGAPKAAKKLKDHKPKRAPQV
ncbi:DEAD/DEAH box helicase [Devosia sp. A449]